jgi:hypothetical protein
VKAPHDELFRQDRSGYRTSTGSAPGYVEQVAFARSTGTDPAAGHPVPEAEALERSAKHLPGGQLSRAASECPSGDGPISENKRVPMGKTHNSDTVMNTMQKNWRRQQDNGSRTWLLIRRQSPRPANQVLLTPHADAIDAPV